MPLPKSFAVASVATVLWAAAQAAFPAPMTMDPIETEHLRLAHAVIQATGVEENLRKTFHNIIQQNIANAKPQTTQEAKNIEISLSKYAEERADYYIPELESAADRNYAENFSDEQLKYMAAFFNSRVGQLYVSKAPEIAAMLSHTIALPDGGSHISQKDVDIIISTEAKKMRDLISPTLTEADTRQIIEFASSPTARAIQEKRNALVQELVPILQTFVNQLNHDRMEKWCDLIHCTPRMRSWIDHPELMKEPQKANR